MDHLNAFIVARLRSPAFKEKKAKHGNNKDFHSCSKVSTDTEGKKKSKQCEEDMKNAFHRGIT